MAHPRTWLQLLRVPQWSKNAVVFAALVFGEPKVEHALWRAVVAFVAFCAISSAGYIFNDYRDRELDRLHPVKRKRPIASGSVSTRTGIAIAVGLTILGFVLSFIVNPILLVVMMGYSMLTSAYSLYFKRIVLLDAFVIATGFLLRAVAGAAAVEVPVSAWLMLCTMLLALFLAFGKRRSELVRMKDDAVRHRPTLAGYSIPLLDQLLVITAGCTIMAYSFYSFTSESVPRNGLMMLTVPFVVFAVFRYLLLVVRRGEGSAPEILLWSDKPLLGSVISWGIVALAIIIAVR